MPSDFQDTAAANIDIDTAAADAIAARFLNRGTSPGLAYGIVAEGRLVHSAGFGTRIASGAAPDADTVFRIASMSKSFTATAVLLLRDAGLLALDDPAEKYVPELASWPPVTADADRITIRHLLTMTAGFPTDDPWGDRQQGLPLPAFGALLAGGLSFNWAPGTRFEYSNLGYATLGRVITAASGVPYDEFVRTRVMGPLGMMRTAYTAEEFGGVSAPAGGPAGPVPAAAANLAQGYRRGGDGWEAVPFEPYGAFAPMGGVYSTVRDLATWVSGFAAAFPPGASGAQAGEDPHPLRRASRREMQLPQAVTGWRSPDRLPGGPSGSPAYYGFGLFVDEDPGLGRTVGHSGGYPGFGSNMRWHPATGVGVVALGNGTYCNTSGLTAQVLRAVVPASASYHVALAPSKSARAGSGAGTGTGAAAQPGGPWPETEAARAAVNELLRNWDDVAADALFAPNVAWDAPYVERRQAIELMKSRIGSFGPSMTRAPESDAPAHCRWWLTGERGTVQAQIQLSPERTPRVQSLSVAIPPEAGSALDRVLSSVVAWLNSGSATWPESIPVAAGTDVTLLTRRLRMAGAWAGAVAPGVFRGGDGSGSVSVELDGEHAAVVLSLAVNPNTGELRAADVTL
ncbi:MAG TPA: serine hydrolase domain-containing protein [Trebonia sp.]|nr:serine hydrolase domain-containing protein [Trebonia sp.]